MYDSLVYSQYGKWAPWLESTEKTLVEGYGLDRDFAQRAAVLLAYAMAEGLNPRIASGFRDPQHQAELRARWDRGDRAGLRVRPAADSEHSHMAGRKPAARAADFPCKNDARMAQIAKALGIGAGATFKVPDPGHYFHK